MLNWIINNPWIIISSYNTWEECEMSWKLGPQRNGLLIATVIKHLNFMLTNCQPLCCMLCMNNLHISNNCGNFIISLLQMSKLNLENKNFTQVHTVCMSHIWDLDAGRWIEELLFLITMPFQSLVHFIFYYFLKFLSLEESIKLVSMWESEGKFVKKMLMTK